MVVNRAKYGLVLVIFICCSLGQLPIAYSAGLNFLHSQNTSKVSKNIVKTSNSNQLSEKLTRGASNFVESMASRALDFLSDEEMSHDKKKRKFHSLLEDSFDMRTIGRFSLGRYWRVANKEQRDQYQKLFKEMVIEVYSGRFGEYSGQKFEVVSHRADGEKDTIVTSKIISGEGTEIQVDWRVRYKKERYQIVDVIVEGVSMSVTQRSEFAAVIQRGGGNVDVLLAHLEEK